MRTRNSPQASRSSSSRSASRATNATHDLREVDLAQRQLLPQDERQQQVERPLERVEVELELADEGRGHRAGG